MTEFEVRIPYRDRDDLTVEVVDAARRRWTAANSRWSEELALGALRRGVTSAGQLLDEIESADPAEQRQIVDKAREDVGLRSLSEIEERQRIAAVIRDDPPPPRDQNRVATKEARRFRNAPNRAAR